MNIRRRHRLDMGVVVLAVLIYVVSGAFDPAYAGLPPAAPIDATCKQASTYGLTAGLVFCLMASIGGALNAYLPPLQNFLEPYKDLALVVALAIFGLKLMSSQIKQPIKDGALLLTRVAIGLWVFEQGNLIYQWIAGIPPSATGGSPTSMNQGIIYQVIDWVVDAASGFSAGGTDLFSTLVSPTCEAENYIPAAGVAPVYAGVEIWRAFDCIFARIFGAVIPTRSPEAFAASMMLVISAALFSGTLGVTVAALGVSVMLQILFMVFRAIFMVLISYLTVAFCALLSPLIAPLYFFDSATLQEYFRKWVGLIVSTMFQPVIVLGFLAMVVRVYDFVIEGQFPTAPVGTYQTPCRLPTWPTAASTTTGEPVLGWGQNGSGVCSFTQLMQDGRTGAVLLDWMHSMTGDNNTLSNSTMGGSPQAQSAGIGTWLPLAYYLNTSKPDTIPILNQLQGPASSSSTSGFTQTRKWTPLKQFSLTLITLIFLNKCLQDLLKVVPKMAAEITGSIGVGLWSNLQVPFEGMVNRTLKGAEEGAKGAMSGRGLVHGNLSSLSVPGLTGATSGAIKGALEGLIGFRRRPPTR